MRKERFLLGNEEKKVYVGNKDKQSMVGCENLYIFWSSHFYHYQKRNLYQQLNSLDGEKGRFNAPDQTSRI